MLLVGEVETGELCLKRNIGTEKNNEFDIVVSFMTESE